MKNTFIYILFFGFFLVACHSSEEKIQDLNIESELEETTAIDFYLGADLSYVNEMENCNAIFKNDQKETTDPFTIFANEGANLVRVRLWHNPTWTNYSNFKDVEKTIARAKNAKMKVLLDFHYSDDWADPNKQEIPAAWLEVVDNTAKLGDSIYNYTYKTLQNLHNKNLLPDMVQVGNETNIMILQKDDKPSAMNWSRNAYLLNKGIKAVRNISKDVDKNIEVMLHIAQPENAIWWFKQAKENNVVDFDWIGLSYYPKWSTYNLQEASEAFKTLIKTYNKKLMVVETAYPFTIENADAAGNILGADALIDGYKATQEGQLKYLLDLKKALKNAGAKGLVYWEPAWVANNCSTRWGKGSHWDNATLFDANSVPTKGMNFYNQP